MWDLIVSVPDHCLSFYFKTWYMQQMIVSRLAYCLFFSFRLLSNEYEIIS